MKREDLPTIIKEDLKEMLQELPIFLWHMLPLMIGLLLTCQAQQFVQRLFGV